MISQQASFNKSNTNRVVKYEPKHKWICLNLIMETAVNLFDVKKLTSKFDINTNVKLCDNFEIPFIQCIISKIHKKLRIIISKSDVESLWKIAIIVFKYRYNKSALEAISDYCFDCDLDCNEDPLFNQKLNKVGKYKTLLTNMGFKTNYIPNCVKFKFKI